MRLVHLNPKWIGAGGAGISRIGENGEHEPVPKRSGVGLMFDCPCGCDSPLYVDIKNPLDGKGLHQTNADHFWARKGEDFETLTLTPSILRKQIRGEGCGWHGFVTSGEIITV